MGGLRGVVGGLGGGGRIEGRAVDCCIILSVLPLTGTCFQSVRDSGEELSLLPSCRWLSHFPLHFSNSCCLICTYYDTNSTADAENVS